MTERSRRDKKSKVDTLAEYRRVRDGGSRNWKEEEDVDIYDEVTEDQYRSIVKGRLQKDDFVVDDGVGGYMDNGMDDWTGGDDPALESEDEAMEERKRKRKAQLRDKAGPSKSRAKAKPPPPVAPSISAYRPAVSAEQESDLMSSILGSMDAGALPPITPIKSRKRKSSNHNYNEGSSSPIYSATYGSRYEPTFDDTSSDGVYDDAALPPSSDDIIISPKKKVKTSSGTVTPATEKLAHLGVHSGSEDYDDVDMADFMAVDDDELLEMKPTIKKEKKEQGARKLLKLANGTSKESEESINPSWLAVHDSLLVDTSEGFGPSKTPSSGSQNNISALEPDGSLRFFWLDYIEHEGRVYFVGKLKDKASDAWVSCCITVENLQRNLFLLPREKRVDQDEDGQLYETDIVPELKDIYDDFDMMRRKVGIKSWKGKFVKRKYAFGEVNIPRQETQWLKAVYGFNDPQIPNTACSPNIARIFGTATSAFELLVLKRKIMGPCWLRIKNPQIDNKGVSWCKLEATVSDPKDINPIPETDPDVPKDMPPLTVLSISIRTVVNHRENKREIVCTTARIWKNLFIDDPTPPEKLPCSVHTFVRPLDRFPPKFEAKAKANSKGLISSMTNERMLLNSLLVTIFRADPDVLVGHDFLGVSLDVLLNRMRELKADHWSRIGRFRRSKWPSIGKQGFNLKFLSGRMLCDLSSEGAKGMIASTTWSLTELCKTYLKSDRQDIDPDDTASYFDGSLSTPDHLLTFVRHCELDAHYQMAIAAKVQILPLTKQLTNLAGNSWNKTLNGGRAERNEYILLHEFHRLKYICPDKSWGKKAVIKQDTYDDEGDTGKTKGKRDKYKGGLVLEPKRGLWDKYILVMDFNSLYPSIIQEYNIDFTTVDQVDDEENEDKIPDPPPSDVPKGVLPRLIATLVNRRRQVKSLMKDRSISHAQLLQYDIKQMALKLTANSMYGCLGFEHSRFYARPLAALTTFKGREILGHTKELAESLQLDVVYGDTDSVFVNSGVNDLSKAVKISSEFKKAVNDRYKLLEIDLDGVFQRLLLLQKKKYAALKVVDVEKNKTTTEVKGLDMKRREYCALSKNVSQYVLEQILSGEATETVIQHIHEYLSTIGDNIREGKIPLDDYIIFKRLGKNPEDYPDAKSQPHVQVALRLKAKGGSARSGDVIPYIFCLSDGEEPSKGAQAERARHPDEVRRHGSELKIDYEYYLVHQVLPPIERLCEPIEGTDRARLAECLGLDPSRYHSPSSGDGPEQLFATLDSQISDKERYKDASPFLVRCRSCQGQLPFAPIYEKDSSLLLPCGPTCPACQASLPTGSLQMQLETQIREHIARYYEGWTLCDDPTCGNRTRMMGVYGRRCLRQGCRGSVTFEYSDLQLYNQLRYFAFLFDTDQATKAASAKNSEHVQSVVTKNAEFLETMSASVDKYLDHCGRRWVDLSGVFSFMSM